MILDRHPAFGLGLERLVGDQSDMTPVGGVASPRELWPLLQDADPDVVVIDHDAATGSRMALCVRITSSQRARVVIFTSEPGRDLIVPATLAGAGAIVDKADDPRALLAAIRAVADGRPALAPVTVRLQRDAAARLAPRDRPVFAMRLAGTAMSDIGAVVGLSARRLEGRLAGIVAALGTGARGPRPGMAIA